MNERLTKLANFLETNEKVKKLFNINTWARDSGKCGTTHCALGWACLMPEFREKGLHLSLAAYPAFDGLSGYSAGIEFFGISDAEGVYIFSPGTYKERYPKIDKVVERIHRIARGEGIPDDFDEEFQGSECPLLAHRGEDGWDVLW